MAPERFYAFDLGNALVEYTFPEDWVDKARDLQEHLSNAPHDWEGYYDIPLDTEAEDVRERAFLRVTVDSIELYERTHDGDMSYRLADDPEVAQDAPLPNYPQVVFSSMVPHYVLKEYEDTDADDVRYVLSEEDTKVFDRVIERRREINQDRSRSSGPENA